MADTYCVYIVTNLVTGKKYVGKGVSAKKRWWHHCSMAAHGSAFPLHRAIRKYGRESFLVEMVAELSDESAAFHAEREAIARLGTRDPRRGYNATNGGEGCSGRPMSQKARATLVAWNASPEAATVRLRALRAAHDATRGKPLSEDRKRQLSEINRGREITWGNKISAAKRGIDTVPAEIRRHLADRKRGMKRPASVRAKISTGLRGRAVSETTRAKIRLGQERAGKLKLTDEHVRTIRERFAADEPAIALAREYGVTATLICRIARGQSRTSVGGPLTMARRRNPNAYRRAA